MIKSILRALTGKKSIKIAYPNKVDYDQDYRRPNDRPNVIRVKQKAPKGFPKKLHEWVPIAGISQYQKTAKEFINGSKRSVTIEIELDNPVQENALMVLGSWETKDGRKSGQLGYVPAEIRAKLVKELKQDPPTSIAANLDTMYKAEKNKSAGIRINIWGKAVRKKKKK